MIRAALFALLFMVSNALAHSASDAYLTITSASNGRIEGQWDVALRDLHFVLALDDDGDGKLTWGEVRKHEARIARYAYDRLRVSSDGKACTVRPTRQAISGRADGAYAAFFFTIACEGKPNKLTLDYSLFFDVDPSHRGIVVFNMRNATSTSLFSPDKPHADFTLPRL